MAFASGIKNHGLDRGFFDKLKIVHEYFRINLVVADVR